MFKRNLQGLSGNLSSGLGRVPVGSHRASGSESTMPEFTMSGSPCSFKQQEEDELNPLCSSPLSPHRSKGWDKTGKSSRCPHPIQWKVLCAAFVVTRNRGAEAASSREDSLDGHLGQ